jgi:hypothetical protein
MSTPILYAKSTLVLLGKEYAPGDELPRAAGVTRSDVGFDHDSRGAAFVTDRQGRHWRVTGASSMGPTTATLDRSYDPGADLTAGLVERGLATTDAGEAAALRKISELEEQRNAETSDVVDAQLAKLRVKLPQD